MAILVTRMQSDAMSLDTLLPRRNELERGKFTTYTMALSTHLPHKTAIKTKHDRTNNAQLNGNKIKIRAI